jgi:serine/threonine protein kinase
LFNDLNQTLAGSGVKKYAVAYINKKYRDAQKPLQFTVTTKDGLLRGALLNSKGTTADASVIRTEDRRFFDEPLDPRVLMQEQGIMRISEPVTFTSEWTEQGKRDVVVKLLNAGDSDPREVRINRLLNEGLERTNGSSGRCSPARVEGKGAWLFMEWAKRGDLAAVLRGIEGAAPEPRLRAALERSLARQCVSAVFELHEQAGVSHRDIKPENFVLADSGEVRLIDFGQSITQRQYFGAESGTDYIGTTGYRAPELGQREAISWRRADKFSLGVVLWEIAGLGRPDPKGYQDTDTLRGDTLENIAKKLMASQPEKRPHLSHVLKYPYFGAGILTAREIDEALKDLPHAALP